MADVTLDLHSRPDVSFPRATSLVIHMKSQTDLAELVIIITLRSNKRLKDLTSGTSLVCNCEYLKCCVCTEGCWAAFRHSTVAAVRTVTQRDHWLKQYNSISVNSEAEHMKLNLFWWHPSVKVQQHV